MASEGPNNPSAATTSAEAPWDDLNWADPTNVYTSNDARATNFASLTTAYSYVLRIIGFGFAVPGDATVDGILVEIEGYDMGDYAVLDLAQLTKDGTTRVGDDYGTGQDMPDSESYFASLGGAADLWGTTWTPAEINSANFGVHVAIYHSAGKWATQYIDHVRITVTYTEGGGGTIIPQVMHHRRHGIGVS